ncbi:MAG: alanine--glyoxylate aminotransferase family protein [candidate division KSB1 bacterium]|nr:alanine--glyoxylate aminotransferase family protein [candidate division KSB1 bacterium]
MRQRLFTPGPTQIPERVIVAMAQPFPYHRGPAFKKLFEEVITGLQYVFQTQNEVLILTTSGTGGMEACVANLLLAGQKVLVLTAGKFGERWQQVCRAYGLETVTLEVPWGEAPRVDDVKNILQVHRDLAAVFCTHSETSTGVAMDVRAISELVHAHTEALMIVDGITSVGVLPFFMDEWKIDVCVNGSQKGLMVPPGLAFVALSERALERFETQQRDETMQRRQLPRYYLDFSKAREAARERMTAWTPAITLLMGLQESLRMIRETGLENLWQHYARLAKSMRAGMTAIGLELFAKAPSDALTAVKVPPGIDGRQFNEILRTRFGVTVAGGQGALKGKIFRITHMGDYDHLDMLAAMAAVELALKELGWRVEVGAGVAVMQKMFAAYGAESII